MVIINEEKVWNEAEINTQLNVVYKTSQSLFNELCPLVILISELGHFQETLLLMSGHFSKVNYICYWEYCSKLTVMGRMR